jgi:hypothetical protein
MSFHLLWSLHQRMALCSGWSSWSSGRLWQFYSNWSMQPSATWLKERSSLGLSGPVKRVSQITDLVKQFLGILWQWKANIIGEFQLPYDLVFRNRSCHLDGYSLSFISSFCALYILLYVFPNSASRKSIWKVQLLNTNLIAFKTSLL